MTRETAAATAGPAGFPRAAARRPRVVLVDVFETILRVDALGSRFVDVGRPADVVDRAHVTAERLDDTVIRLLNLPA